jgi:hypothetical protein
MLRISNISKNRHHNERRKGKMGGQTQLKKRVQMKNRDNVIKIAVTHLNSSLETALES